MFRPRTVNGLNSSEVISGLQKHIRRGEERQAMQAAAELLFSEQKSNASWLVNRLVAIAHEDIGIANPAAVMFVNSTVPHIRDLLKENKRDRAGLLIANCLLLLCRDPKSRLGDHFQCAAGKPVKLGIEPYAIPDYAHDKHTHKGRSAGKDLQHFRDESAKLESGERTGLEDPYVDDAYRWWAWMEEHGSERPIESGQPKLFEDD